MLQISKDEDGTVRLRGILDASQADDARAFFDTITHSCDVDFQNLEYISSAGLGVLLATQKRMASRGEKLRLVNVPHQLRKVFEMVRFGLLFEID